MTKQSRREFLEQSMLSAAAAAAAANWGSAALAEEAAKSAATSPNDKIGVALIGAGGRGAGDHMPNYTRPGTGTEILWIVDPDENRGQEAVKQAAKRQGRAPKFARDMHEAFADKAVDVASIATPHHWHSLAAIWAMQAGKDVYVEKPVSHNVTEGRRCVEAARKYNKICQTGTQCRTMPGMREAMEYLHQGNLGEVKLARGLCYKKRGSIGPRGVYPTPVGIDYPLWLGPAPEAAVTRRQFHYDWHWQWPYGNGDLGNQGVHQMDIARWGLGEPGLCNGVVSYGGRVGYVDAGDTPNTQVVMFDYGAKTLIFEVRGLETAAYKRKGTKVGATVGVIFEGSDGRTMVIPSYDMGIVFDKDGTEVKRFTGSNDDHLHFVNFLDAVRSRKADGLNADILVGHVSSALCHLGNISYMLGKAATLDQIEKSFDETQKKLPAIGGGIAQEAFARTKQHLDENDIDLDTKIQLGATLKFDPSREEFVGDENADKMLTREYRAPFVVPTKDQV